MDTVETVLLTEEAFRSYLETALWSSTDGDRPLDDSFSIEDIHPDCIPKLKEYCQDFLVQASPVLSPLLEQGSATLERVMHDFWLTRNGHGAGFWDGDYPEPAGSKLTEISKTYGGIDPYVGDDKCVWIEE